MPPAEHERRALIIGAGLAGAAVCAELTRLGWHVTLLDAADGPARAASALPVGMLSPHVTRAPTPLSRLSALGVADMRGELDRLLRPGHGWQACEVDNLGHDPGRWPAALVRPAALVHAWLREADATGRYQHRWGASVAQLLQRAAAGGDQAPVWVACDAAGQELARAPCVVVASAFGSLALLRPHVPEAEPDALPLRPVKGQMSLGPLQGAPLADRPMRQNGVFVPLYEDAGLAPEWPTRIWSMGSTYHRGNASTTLEDADHERNLDSLRAIHPPAAGQMQLAAERRELLGWAQVRCASLDRLPLMGAVPDLRALRERLHQPGARRGRLPLEELPRLNGLFVLTALGSRGLTLAHWCAQQLAGRIAGVPAPPVDTDLLRALDPARFAWRLARRQEHADPLASATA